MKINGLNIVAVSFAINKHKDIKRFLVAFALVCSFAFWTDVASADLIFEVSKASDGGLLFTAAGFSGNITLQSGSPTYLQNTNPVFAYGLFGISSDGNFHDSTSTLQINGHAGEEYIFHNSSVLSSVGDVIRLQNFGFTATDSTPEAITSFSGSFEVSAPGITLPDLSTPITTSTFWTASNGYNIGTVTLQQASAVPEPTTLTMLGIGLVGMVVYQWRRRKAAAIA